MAVPGATPPPWPPVPAGWPPSYAPAAPWPTWTPEPPPHPATSYLAPTGDRVGAFLVDAVVLLLLTLPVYAVVVAVFFGVVASSGAAFFAAASLTFPLMLLPIVLQMAYVVLTEGRTGQSLGKRLVGIRVVKVDGRPIAWHDALIRWICLVVDQQPTLGILGLIMVSTKPLKQRVGDLAAGTIVVRAG